MQKRRFANGVLTALCALFLSACGSTALAHTSSTSPQPTSTPPNPPSLNGVAVSVLASAPLAPKLDTIRTELVHTYPHLSVPTTVVAPSAMNLTSLQDTVNLRLFSVNPGKTLLGQLGGVVHVPIATATLDVSVNLPGGLTPTLTDPILIGILQGSITNWDDSLISSANPGMKLPDLPITISQLTPSGERATIITRELSVLPATYGATQINRCQATQGCLDMTMAPSKAPLLPIEINSGPASLPGSAQYPLSTKEVAVVSVQTAHPLKEIGAITIAENFVKQGNLTNPVRTSELAGLRSLLSKLSVAQYATST